MPNATPSHVLLHGLLTSGATASVAVHGGNEPIQEGFLLKFVGSDGTLTATPAQRGTFIHWGDWDIRIGDDVLAVPDTYRTVPAGVRSGPPANIAALYQEVAQAITGDRQPHPNFEAALRLNELLDGYKTVDDVEPVAPDVRCPRSGQHTLGPDEDPHNAWYLRTSIKGAPSGALSGQTIAVKDSIMIADARVPGIAPPSDRGGAVL